MQLGEKLDLVWSRFIHRDDVFALQQYDEKRGNSFRRITQGVCTKGCPKRTCPHVTSVPISMELIHGHLKGEHTVGIYQLATDDTVKWLCLDVDIKRGANLPEHEARTLAQQHTTRLAEVMQTRKIPFAVEESGSKGYHLWVFFSEPVPAPKAMALGRYIDGRVPPPEHLSIEVFPKQTSISSYGNLVKLPFGVHQKTEKRCFFVNRKFIAYEQQFDYLSSVKTATPQMLGVLLATYAVVVPATLQAADLSTHVGKSGIMTPPCMDNIMREGFEEGHGQRDVGAFKLACYWRDRGATYEMALAAMTEWNQRNRPPLDMDKLITKIDSAFKQDYTYFPCAIEQLDPMCESSCRFFTRKVEERIGRYGRAADKAAVQALCRT